LTGAGNQPPAEKRPRNGKNPIQEGRQKFLALTRRDCQRGLEQLAAGDAADAQNPLKILLLNEKRRLFGWRSETVLWVLSAWAGIPA
jgi:hypothetical protein